MLHTPYQWIDLVTSLMLGLVLVHAWHGGGSPLAGQYWPFPCQVSSALTRGAWTVLFKRLFPHHWLTLRLWKLWALWMCDFVVTEWPFAEVWHCSFSVVAGMAYVPGSPRSSDNTVTSAWHLGDEARIRERGSVWLWLMQLVCLGWSE